MPESAVAEVAADPEPKDRRTTAWREWSERKKSASTPSPEAPPAPSAPPPPAASAVPASAILTPEEFIVPFLTDNPQAVTEFQGNPNPERSLADACSIAYQTYLILVSPSYNAWYREQMPVAKRPFLPKPGFLRSQYDIAVGK